MRELNFISVETVGSPRTKLKGDNNKAWRRQLSLEQQNLSCEHCLVMRFQGDLGLAKQLNDSSTVGMYLGAVVQNNRI